MSFLHFRFAAIYLVMLNIGITLILRYAVRRADSDLSARRSAVRFTIIGVWSGMMVFFATVPDVIILWDFEPWVPLRWSAVIPGFGAIFLTSWACRSRLGLDSEQRFVVDGPYRWCAYPADAAWVVLFLSGAALGSNWVIIATSLVAMLALRTLVPREQDAVREALLGDAYRQYTERAGCFLPATATVDESQYLVPNRFGLTAILGLLTVLAFIFGILRYYESPPIIYLFVVSEIVAICLVQIFFGAAPRGGSVLTGAILLPFWVYLHAGIALADGCALYLGVAGSNYYYVLIHASILSFFAVFGALLGYCIGAFAAGFFLLMDMIEPWLTGEDKAADNQSSSSDQTLKPRAAR